MIGLGDRLAAFPAFVAGSQRVVTAKSIVVYGEVHGSPAVAKWLTHPGRVWRDRFRHEIRTYERLQSAGLRGPMPSLLFADPVALVLVVGRAPGSALSTERHPLRDVPAATAEAVIGACARVEALSPWRISSLRRPFDAQIERLDRHRVGGWVPERIANRTLAETARLRDEGTRPTFAHGDPIGPNVFVASRCILVDWEFAGFRVPRYDVSVLWTVARRQPTMRRQIISGLGPRSGPNWRSFAANVVTMLARERRMHEALPLGDLSRARLPGIAADLEHAGSLVSGRG